MFLDYSAVFSECRFSIPAPESHRSVVLLAPIGEVVAESYPIRTVIQFSRCIGDLRVQFSEKRCSLPYIQKVGKEHKNAWISTLMEMEMKYATETHCSGKIERFACRRF